MSSTTHIHILVEMIYLKGKLLHDDDDDDDDNNNNNNNFKTIKLY